MKKGPTDFTYITPEEYFKLDQDTPLDELKRRAASKATCITCDLPAWKLANTGMCFPCTTGESDASNDYELIG